MATQHKSLYNKELTGVESTVQLVLFAASKFKVGGAFEMGLPPLKLTPVHASAASFEIV